LEEFYFKIFDEIYAKKLVEKKDKLTKLGLVGINVIPIIGSLIVNQSHVREHSFS
jgi:hypothetical protein